jgi:hypothetical protein
MSPSRATRAAALERWADTVAHDEFVEADTSVLKHLAALADQRRTLESELAAAVGEARRAKRSWSEIGLMLGVSKQAAQRKYNTKTSAA